MTRFRGFLNTDPPALVGLWNRGTPERAVVRPLNPHEFDAFVFGKLGFDPEGLIVAEHDGRIVGYAHAGFAPAEPKGKRHQFDPSLGATVMLLVEPGLDEPEIDRGLVLAAEDYLRRRGAQVLYAGGQWPLNPFYWGIYGGSEFAGVLSGHVAFHRAVERTGYQPVSTTILLEADLARSEPRDPRTTLLKRQVRLEITEDAQPEGWWSALAIGLFRLTRFEVFDRVQGHRLARATTWDIASGYGLGDGRPRAGLVDFEVDPEHRRRGLGRHLVAEVFRHARAQMTELVSVQTSSTNLPAIGLYKAAGFEPVETATLYRLPAELTSRSAASDSA